MAHGGGHHGSRAALHVEVRGLVTAVTAPTESAPASITVSPGGSLAPWTCALRDGADTAGIVANTTTVKMKCRVRKGVLTAKRLRTTENTEGKVKVAGRGLVTAFTAPVTTTTPTTPATPADPKAPGTSTLLDTSGGDPATPSRPGHPGRLHHDARLHHDRPGQRHPDGHLRDHRAHPPARHPRGRHQHGVRSPAGRSTTRSSRRGSG